MARTRITWILPGVFHLKHSTDPSRPVEAVQIEYMDTTQCFVTGTGL